MSFKAQLEKHLNRFEAPNNMDYDLCSNQELESHQGMQGSEEQQLEALSSDEFDF